MFELLFFLPYFGGIYHYPQEHARQVPTAEAAAYAARMGCLFVETSAKTAIGVCAAFRDAIERVVETPWVVGQESHNVTPSRVTSPVIEHKAVEDSSVDSSERAHIIGSISFVGRSLSVRFGGLCGGPAQVPV